MLLAWQFDILGPEWQLGAPTGESVDSLKDIDILTNIDSLTSTGGAAGLSDASQGWAVFRVIINLGPAQGVGDTDAARVTSAINFFKPVRCLLDSIWFNLAPIADIVTAPSDTVISIFKQSDSAPPPRDLVAAAAWVVSDVKVIAPLYDRHFYHTGITYGPAQPGVADSGVVVLGSAVAAGA